jgi:hypothetical protein
MSNSFPQKSHSGESIGKGKYFYTPLTMTILKLLVFKAKYKGCMATSLQSCSRSEPEKFSVFKAIYSKS